MILYTLLAAALAFGPQIIDVSLVIDDAAAQALRDAPESDVPGTLAFRDDGVDQRYAVSIHVKGQLGSRRSVDDKPAFKITILTGKRFLGLEHLTLNNMVQDPTMLREALGYQVYEAAGVPVPRTGYVRLTVNSQNYGLYLNVETIDSLFLKHHFGNSSGILYEGSYGADLSEGTKARFQWHEGSDPGRDQLTAFIRAVEGPGDDLFYGKGARVDTSGFLAMMAAAALLDDWDGYYAANNYRIYWNPAVKKWCFIPTGIDQTFGGYATSVYGASGVLFMRCLKSPRCITEYSTIVRDVAARFERLGLATKMDALLSLIEEACRSDPRRPYDDETMRRARESMRRFIDSQPTRILAELPSANPPN